MKRQIALLPAIVALSCLSTPAARAENWPCFRGPTGQGISHEQQVPTSWTATSGIAWKTELPGEGVSSPIVFGDRVYVTVAQDDGASLRLICFDAETGALLWNKELLEQKAGHKSRQNSFATSTPATDGRRIYVAACDGRVVAVTMDGEPVWTNADFDYYSEHGLAVSPVLYGDMVIMAYDWSSPGPNKKLGWQVPWDKSLILALDTSTGQARWQGRRGSSRIAHVTPLIVRVDDADQLVSGAGDVVQGFDLRNGQRL
ncbi:MAG: PQQ-binding-like beta-propeller repeat protein, partial [Phycisphaerales bacterium]